MFEVAVVYTCASVSNSHGRVLHGRTKKLPPGSWYYRWHFFTFVGHRKRKEHGLETWALFIDLVKVFDTVPRKALFCNTLSLQFVWSFINIAIRLHENALINVKIVEDSFEVESSIGVRQGSCEGPPKA